LRKIWCCNIFFKHSRSGIKLVEGEKNFARFFRFLSEKREVQKTANEQKSENNRSDVKNDAQLHKNSTKSFFDVVIGIPKFFL